MPTPHPPVPPPQPVATAIAAPPKRGPRSDEEIQEALKVLRIFYNSSFRRQTASVRLKCETPYAAEELILNALRVLRDDWEDTLIPDILSSDLYTFWDERRTQTPTFQAFLENLAAQMVKGRDPITLANL